MSKFSNSLGHSVGTGQINTPYYSDIFFPSVPRKPAASQGTRPPAVPASAALTQTLPKKIGFVAEALSFFSEKVKAAISASRDGSVNISVSAGAEADQFMTVVQAMSLGFSEQDVELTKKAKNGEIVLTTSTLQDWANGLESRIREMNLLASKLDSATVDVTNALSADLQKMETSMEDIPSALPPPTGRARAFYSALASARTFVLFKADPFDRQYQSLLKGLEKKLPASVTGDERYFQSEVLGDIKRQAETALGKNFDVDSTFKQGWEKWKQETLTKMGLATEGSFGASVNAFYQKFKRDVDPARGQAGLDIAMERAKKVVTDAVNFRLEKELPNLGKNLLNNSEYEKFHGSLKERRRRQESGRLYASMSALWAVADEAAFAAYADSNSGTHWLTAAQQLSSALQVPFSFVMASVEANRDGKSVREVVNTYLDPSKKVSEVTPVRRDSIELQSLDRGGRVQLAPASTLSEEGRLSLLRAAETSRFNVRSLKEIKTEFGKNAVFLGADVLSLAVDINRAVVTKDMTKLQEARLAMDFLTDISFFTADALGVIANGPLAGTLAKGAGALGMGLSWAGSAMGIADTVEKFQGKPELARETTLAVYNFISTILSTATSYAHPAAGVILTMLLPNGAAISQALNLQDAYNDLMSKGRTLEAAQVKTLHTIAALDSTPVINAFGAIYRSLLNNPDKLSAAEVNPWVNGVFRQRMDSLMKEMTTELTGKSTETKSDEFHLITSMKQQIDFSERPEAGRTNSGSSRRTISSWVDFGLKRDTAAGAQAATPTSWQSDEFSVVESNAWKTVDGKRVPLNFIPKKKNAESTLTQQTAGDWGAVKGINKAFYLIEKGNADQPATLVLDHTASTIETTYQVNDATNLRIRAGAGNDVFQLGVTPLEIDGGGGMNVAGYGLATKGMTIDLSKGKNISVWVGSKFANQVKGTSGNDNYRSGSASAADVISLGDGDDMASVGAKSTVDMGAGDDVTFFMGIAGKADGGAGNDVASFQLMTEGVTYRTAKKVSNIQAGASKGFLSNYEAFIGTDFADTATIRKGDSIKTWNLGAGNDSVRLGCASDTTIFLGAGNNTLISEYMTGKPMRRTMEAYDNVGIFGGDGIDRVNVGLFNSHKFSISGAEGNDEISVEAYTGSSSNRVEIIGGTGDDTIRLKGNVEAVLRFRVAEGTDNIYDDAKRGKAMTLVFDGRLKKEDIKTSVIKDGVSKDAAGNTYAYIVEVTGGDTKARLHTYTVPGEIKVQTTEDRNVSTIDLASLWQGSSANAGMQKRAGLLVDSMASFGVKSGASSRSSLLARETPRVALAAAA